MTKKSFINALLAELYVVFVVLFIQYGVASIGSEVQDTLLMPIAMLSLFVLSVAVMGYFFIFEPVSLYLDGEKKQAKNLFIYTILTFALITGVAFLLLFSRFLA